MTQVAATREPSMEAELEALVPAPTGARRVAAWVGTAFGAFVTMAVLAPWQQSVQGSGRVIAFAPLERQQTVESPLDGRAVRVYVVEGSIVKKGDPLVDLTDVDPSRLERLDDERRLVASRVGMLTDRARVLRERIDSIRGAQESAVRAAEARVRSAESRIASMVQAVLAADAELNAAVLNYARHRELVRDGLVSERELELALAGEARAKTARDAAKAQLDAQRAEYEAARAAHEQARSTRSAELETATAAAHSADIERDGESAALIRLETSVARQGSQRVVAPIDATVLRVSIAQGGEQVKAGDPLVVLVPDTTDRSVAIWIDGNDAALVTPGRHVRLQFEGWPAVQFVGWPSVAVGSFGGTVAFVDATDDGVGNFRVIVVPDGKEPWPEARFLRQGVRANAWILLERVSVGFEMWRQVNGFPPTLRNAPGLGEPAGADGKGTKPK